MSAAMPAVLQELLDEAQAAARDPELKRRRVPLLIEPWRSWLATLPIVKVAGTNGKGSVCALLSACLCRAGQRPGFFSSPHLVRVGERFRVDDREVEVARLEEHARRVRAHVAALVARHGARLRPSFFEALLALGLDLFQASGCRALVIEAGVGGRYDATSLLPGALGAITTIGLDHQDVLGPSVEAIAADKAGIVGPGARLVLGPRVDARLAQVVRAHAPGVSVSQASVEWRAADQARGRGWSARTRGLQPTRLRLALPGAPAELELPLLGRHQVDNFATFLALAEELAGAGLLPPAALAAVPEAHWPGRLQRLEGGPGLLTDVAHNAEGLAALADELDALVPWAERCLLFGLSSGKDVAACLALVPRLAPRVWLVEGFYRARPASELWALLPDTLAERRRFATPAQALAALGARSPTARAPSFVAAGSVFLIGALHEAWARTREPA